MFTILNKLSSFITRILSAVKDFLEISGKGVLRYSKISNSLSELTFQFFSDRLFTFFFFPHPDFFLDKKGKYDTIVAIFVLYIEQYDERGGPRHEDR